MGGRYVVTALGPGNSSVADVIDGTARGAEAQCEKHAGGDTPWVLASGAAMADAPKCDGLAVAWAGLGCEPG